MKIQTVTIINAQLEWQVRRTKSGTLLGVCDPLGLTLEADDESELINMIGETLHYLMFDMLEDGLLPKFLRDRGWTPSVPLPKPEPEAGIRFDVPFRLVPAHAP